MTPKQLAALTALARFHEGVSVKWTAANSIGQSSAILGSLVRSGLANSCVQEEAPNGRHGRLIRYALYQASKAGLEALAREGEPA